MKILNDFVVQVSRSAWLFIFSTIFASGSMVLVFFNINDVFEGMVDAQLFDFQNGLTVDMIFEQLPAYIPAAQKLYFAFIFVDFFFPFFAGLAMAAAAAFALRHLSEKWYGFVDSRNLFALCLIPTLFDWCENVFGIIVVNGYPDELTAAATLLVLAKKGKLSTLILMQAVTGVLLILAAFRWAGAKVGILK
jgi:hypothetical protein